jgi:hypothetical protein
LTGGHAPAAADFRLALVSELRRCFSKPWDVPVVVATNGMLTAIAWFLLPASVREWFFSLHGPLAFPVVLEYWMLADVPATNVVGSDAGGALAALSAEPALRQFLYAKRAVLWLLVAPMCSAIALGVGVTRHTYAAAVSICVVLLILPFGVLIITAYFGIVFPYHQRSLGWRWRRRRDLRQSCRWLVLVMAPYCLVPAVASVLVLPSVVVAHRAVHRGTILLTGGGFVVSAVLACVVTAMIVLIGHDIGGKLVRRKGAWLAAYLSDPDRG